ncbi:MAG: DUF1572 family protein [Sphingobacteriales bacterium]|nr:DUF1572 family protein [Sphingobacteriales bacterium]MBI3718098.1 DUF1572 family protein [Sphingobacteriales bacterium]
MANDFLESVIKQFEYYKLLGEKSFEQVSEEQLFWQYNQDSNSIATIVKHLWGNMMSRWTDFLTTDGEKEWRKRDEEFENDIKTKDEMMHLWNEGWNCLFNAIGQLKEEDLGKMVYIRNMGQTVTEAINRQLAHYSYHIGQIVYIARMAAKDWKSLSIPKGESKEFNKEKFSQPKRKEHFADEVLGPNKSKDE